MSCRTCNSVSSSFRASSLRQLLVCCNIPSNARATHVMLTNKANEKAHEKDVRRKRTGRHGGKGGKDRKRQICRMQFKLMANVGDGGGLG